ncbi:hypothetical protein HU200_045496 [Digitaria exilis]|uniref:J domain-containing protein n=1 Tax=Digitaria exilis TaxID=1010633 RepID=A0A835B8C8_9POAL|nr:hypothetical protein HU200_045496 [Digitaria exilis]
MTDSFKEAQARKARALAEKCFLAGDVPGARRWAQSAARLAPDLPGTAQAAAAYDVHAAAAAARKQQPINWYAVLGLARPCSSGSGSGAGVLAHGNIKRQHRRLCLLVHPDKNPSAVADGAFKLIQAAWQALSARYPPAAADDAAAAQPPRRRPDPPPRPQPTKPRQRRAPTKPRGPHQEWGKSNADAARAPQAAAPPTPAPAGCCPSCGALTPRGKRSLRCMVCHWSPID